jgi:hypothetical protein
LLLWSKRSYFTSNSGERTEFGPQFYFYWTDTRVIENSKYATALLSTEIEIALSPEIYFVKDRIKLICARESLF